MTLQLTLRPLASSISIEKAPNWPSTVSFLPNSYCRRTHLRRHTYFIGEWPCPRRRSPVQSTEQDIWQDFLSCAATSGSGSRFVQVKWNSCKEWFLLLTTPMKLSPKLLLTDRNGILQNGVECVILWLVANHHQSGRGMFPQARYLCPISIESPFPLQSSAPHSSRSGWFPHLQEKLFRRYKKLQ